MSQPAEIDVDAACAALHGLVTKVFTKPELRKAFTEEPFGVASSVGVDFSAIPPKAAEVLKGMSEREHAFLAEYGQAALDDGLFVQNVAGGATCIFL